MDVFLLIERVLNNQAVGAFLGAFTAYVLFVMNDRRRARRKVRSIRAEVEMNMALAKSKLEGVRGKRDELTKENRLNTSPLLKFNTALIRQFCDEAVDRLGSDQRRAIEAVCYAMEATDDVLFDANQLATALGNSKGNGERPFAVERLRNSYEDAIANLGRLI